MLVDKESGLGWYQELRSFSRAPDPGQGHRVYRKLLTAEKAFRMSTSDLKDRRIFHHIRKSIDARLTVVMVAMAVGHFLEQRAGLSITRLVRSLKHYWTSELTIAGQTIHADSPIPTEIPELLAKLTPGGRTKLSQVGTTGSWSTSAITPARLWGALACTPADRIWIVMDRDAPDGYHDNDSTATLGPPDQP